MGTLYARIGGEAAITAAVTQFYDRVLADPLLAPFFQGIDTNKLIRKQIGFMLMAFDGPHAYTGRDLTTAHAALVDRGLDDRRFDAVAGHLHAVLDDLSVPEDVRDEAMAVVGSTRDAVLGRAVTP